MVAKTAGAPALDAYLHKSFDLIQFVADNMAVIKSVASHLTPVEDLVDFKATVDALYGKLDLLVEASELIIRTTPIGIRILLAPDAAAERAILELGTAALKDEGYFAKTTDFVALSAYVDQIKTITDVLQTEILDRVTKAEFDETVAGLQTKIDGVNDSTQINDAINDLLVHLAAGEYTTAVNEQLTRLTTRVTNAEETQVGQATTIGHLVSDVALTKEGIVSIAADLMTLHTEVSDAEAQLAGNSTAISNLTTRTDTLEGVVTAQAEDLTQLTAKADNLADNLGAQADALQALSVFASNTDGAQQTTANAVIQLAGRVTDADSEIAAGAAATQSLTTRVSATEEGLLAQSEDITNLKASVTGTGNLLPNAAFAVDTHAWTLFSRGNGWLAAQLQLNLDPTRIPQALNVLGLTAAGVPSGTAGVRSMKLPISALTNYILSGYLAAENCTFSMEWRLFNAAGVQVSMGVAGSVTNVSPATNLVNWTRVFNVMSTDADAALMEVQLWVKACNTAPPKVWFMRPQMEEAVGTQTEPSPWVAGVNSLEETLSSAIQTLTVRVETNEEGLLAQSTALTQLESRIGNVTHWRVVTISGSGDAASVGAPLEPSIRLVSATDAAYSLMRGLTLIRFTANGDIDSALRFDVYSNTSERAALTAALLALGPNDGFLLVSENNHGINDPALTAAMESCGAYAYSKLVGSVPYALRGRGGIGKGAGIENYPTNENQFIDFSFAVTNDMPQGLGESNALSGVAQAVDTLTTEVTEMDGKVTAAAAATTALSARTDGAEGALVDALIIRASRDSVIIGQMNTMDARLLDTESSAAASAHAVTGLETRLTIDEGLITSLTESTTALHNEIEGIGEDLGATNDTVATLTSQVQTDGVNITAQGAAITALESTLTGPGGAVTANATAINALTTRVTSDEGVLESQAAQLLTLGAHLVSLDGEVAGNAAAINAVTVRVTSVEGEITSLASSVTNLESELATVDGLIAANTTAIGSLVTTTTAQGNLLTTQGAALTSITSKINDASTGLSANASAISGLSTRVTSAEGKLTAQATQITGLGTAVGANAAAISQEASARADADSANAGSILKISSSISQADGNLIRTSQFSPATGVGTWSGGYVASDAASPSGYTLATTGTLYETGSRGNDAGGFFQVTQGDTFEGTWRSYTGGLSGSSGYVALGLQILAKDGSTITYANFFTVAKGEGWTTHTGRFSIPLGGVMARPYIFQITLTGTLSIAFMSIRCLSRSTAQSASVTESITANVGPSGAYTQATTMLDSNGYITGVSQTNNGSTGNFAILADKFTIVKPGGGARTEYSGGNWRVYDSAGTLRVQMGVW